MNAEIKARWIEALRSGKYKKGKGELRTQDNQYCCLGVLAEVVGFNVDNCYPEETEYGVYLPDGFAGLDREWTQDQLANLNDQSETFEPVIEWIEKNL